MKLPQSSSRPFQRRVNKLSISFRLDTYLLFNRKMTFKASGRRRCCCPITLIAVCKKRGGNLIMSSFYIKVNFDEESIGDGLEVQKINFFDYLQKRFVRRYLRIKE